MKFSTVLTVLSAAIASSRTVGEPDSSDDVQNLRIAEGEAPPSGDKIPGQNSFNFCKGDRSKDAVKITQVDLVPNPPARGQDLTVSAAGTVNEAIQQGAVVDVKVKFLASVVYHKRFDICEEAGKLGQSCPVLPADILFNETYNIPKKGYPHGSYYINAFAKFPDGRPITCIEGKVKL